MMSFWTDSRGILSDQPTPPSPNLPPSLANLADTITLELDKTQRQLDEIKEQLTESQRMAAIGTIAAVIAHEFNNILTPMISYSQYALASAEGEKPDIGLIRKALSKSFQASTKAGKICNSMLSLARGESSSGPVSVQVLVDEVLQVLARDPQKDGIALRVQVQPNLMISGDQIQLEQVLLNLLINARQAMLGKGGSLTVKAGLVQETGELRLQVIDTGPGIPEKLLPRIFQPFFTTKGTARRGEAKGTGLGLSICRDIIEHHHGRIEVQSEVGRGTIFSIYLPGGRSASGAVAA
jgi:signal transduction histidine kinase